jgi:MFS family permease
MAFTKQQAPIFALLVVAGASMVICVALCNTSIQQRIPDALRGRVLSMYTFAFSGFLPFGNLFGGLLAEHRGFQPTMAMLGGGLIVTAAIAAVLRE